ncbi:UDP-N-acetylglucosamine 2-epimerase [Arcticibacter sp. MXS-1]|uniref:UDP-N-acetylglucosamine 2-epimerase n=1 Tax=Arcticibacter sp. MXS-1 TaxID=3341726 RepID=UPI0035A91780
MKTRICVFTGSRAEYGLLYPLMKLLAVHADFQLQLLVSGMHLSSEFGLTYKQIENDGFHIDEKVEVLLSADSETAIAKSTGIAMMGYADALARLQPDWMLVLGDRFEAFAAVSTAHLKRIPVIHLHGGEITEGATDDALRHAITKMSYLHFTSTESHRNRVIQLGEDPSRVFNTGAIGIDNIQGLKLLGREELQQSIDFEIGDQCVLITFHPVTLEEQSAAAQIEELLAALDAFPELRIVFTLPNADANGRVIIKRIESYVEQHRGRAKAYQSLGQLRYLSLMKHARAVVGNSSSGIIEGPALGKAVLDIGDRQKGRTRAESVVNVAPLRSEITAGLAQILSESFFDYAKTVTNPYGAGGTAPAIMAILGQYTGRPALKKKFFDL